MTQLFRRHNEWNGSSGTPWIDGGGIGVLVAPGVGSGHPWSDYPICGQEDDLDEDERYFLEDEDDDDALDDDDDSDTDSDYDDGFGDDDDEKVDEDMDSDDENF